MPRVRSFQILNHTIKVHYPRTILDDSDDPLRGDCEPDQCLLKVSTMDKGEKIPESQVEHSRWHEHVHLMFHLAGRQDLYEDETLVDTIAGFLAQYEATVRRR